jgi:hypothetical protein
LAKLHTWDENFFDTLDATNKHVGRNPYTRGDLSTMDSLFFYGWTVPPLISRNNSFHLVAPVRRTLFAYFNYIPNLQATEFEVVCLCRTIVTVRREITTYTYVHIRWDVRQSNPYKSKIMRTGLLASAHGSLGCLIRDCHLRRLNFPFQKND